MDRFLAVLGVVLLVGATAEVLLPARLTLDDAGVRLSNLVRRRQLRWSQVRGWRRVPDGALLLGSGPAPIIQRRRTLLLRTEGEHPELLARLQDRLGPPDEGSSAPHLTD